MSQPEKFNGLEKIDLASLEMHAPVEVLVTVYVRLPGEQMGKLTAIMPVGQIPGRAEIKAVFDDFANAAAAGSIPGAPFGARMPTRGEFVSHIVKRETGEPFAIDPDAKYAPLPLDIPRQMLVHAICGTGVPDQMTKEYEARGLTYMGDMGWHEWHEMELDKLPDDMLMAIYQRVTA
jgi:hypothetical protein